MARALLGCAIALLAAGCTTNFRPLQASRGVPPQVASANDDLDEGTYDMGDISVWVASSEDDVLVLGMRLRNDGQTPMHLDREDLQLELRTKDGRLLVLEELEFGGQSLVLPGETGRGEVIAPLPQGVEVDDLVGFELLWAVENEEGMRVTRSSAFRHESWEESQYYR